MRSERTRPSPPPEHRPRFLGGERFLWAVAAVIALMLLIWLLV